MRYSLLVTFTVLSLLIPSLSLGAKHDIGLSLLIDIPREDFANISGTGGGVGLKLMRALRTPMLRMRGDLALLFFGEDEHPGEIYGFEGIIVTRHESFRIFGGFEFTTPPGRSLRAYAAPMAGLYIFRSIDRFPYSYISETESSDTEFGWLLDAGVTFTFARKRHRPQGLELDFGVSYGTVKSGVKSEIVLRNDAGEDVGRKTVETDAKEIIIHVGIIWHRH